MTDLTKMDLSKMPGSAARVAARVLRLSAEAGYTVDQILSSMDDLQRDAAGLRVFFSPAELDAAFVAVTNTRPTTLEQLALCVDEVLSALP